MWRPLSSDTGPEAEKVQLEILGRMSPGRKLEMVADAWDTRRALALTGLRARHPDASEAELQRRFIMLVLGEELYARAYAPRPTA